MPRDPKLPETYTVSKKGGNSVTYAVVQLSNSKGLLRLDGEEYGVLSMSSKEGAEPVVLFYAEPISVAT